MYYVKNVHQVYGAEIWTQNLQYMSLIQLPLDRGKVFNFFVVNLENLDFPLSQTSNNISFKK